MVLSLQTLYRFPLFAGLDADALETLAMAGTVVALGKGDWLFHEGDRADAIYVIYSGAIDLKMFVDAERTRQGDLERLTEGETVGWSALVEPHVYTAGAVAVDDTRLLELGAAHIRELMGQNHEVGYKLMSRLAQIIRRRLTNMRVRFVSLIED